MTFLEKLDVLMVKYGLTKTTLSQKSSIPYTTIDAWYKKGYEGLKLTTLRKLASFFNTTLDYWVLDEISDPNYGKSNGFAVDYDEAKHIEKYRTLDSYGKEVADYILNVEYTRCITPAPTPFPVPLPETVEEGQNPLYNVIPFRNSEQPASAGTGTYLGPEAFETIMVQENDLTKRASFGVPVSGDSMEPRYHDKDILIVERAEELESGEIGIFTLKGEGYVKKLSCGELISLNPEYPPIPMDESISLNGRVIGVLKPDWVVG